MWLVILLLHLFAWGYVVSGQTWSQYTETLTTAITTRLPDLTQPMTHFSPLAFRSPSLLSRGSSQVHRHMP
jgi:hypothetical protein